MTAVYGFCAVVGGVLAAITLFGGGDADADLDADAGTDGLASGAGSVLASLFSLRTLVLALGFFGVTGLVMPLVGTGGVGTLVAATVVGVVAGAVNDRVLRYLRRSASDSALPAEALVGRAGLVSIPVGGGRRGKVTVEAGGRSVGLVAEPFLDAEGVLERDTTVVIVEMNGGVARIAPLDVGD